MAITVTVPKQPSEEFYCNQCKGCCWDPKDNAATQLAAKKLFGIIPNNCIPDNNGHIRCPHSKKSNI